MRNKKRRNQRKISRYMLQHSNNWIIVNRSRKQSLKMCMKSTCFVCFDFSWISSKQSHHRLQILCWMRFTFKWILPSAWVVASVAKRTNKSQCFNFIVVAQTKRLYKLHCSMNPYYDVNENGNAMNTGSRIEKITFSDDPNSMTFESIKRIIINVNTTIEISVFFRSLICVIF